MASEEIKRNDLLAQPYDLPEIVKKVRARDSGATAGRKERGRLSNQYSP